MRIAASAHTSRVARSRFLQEVTMKMTTLYIVCALLAGGAMGALAQTPSDTGATPAARTSTPAKAELSRGDKQFMTHAAEYSMAEIEAGKLAETKATSADVK